MAPLSTHLVPLLALVTSAIAVALPAHDRRSFAVSQPEKRAGNGKDTIVQLFEWNWDSVAKECTEWLGPAGYGYAQVSPPQEHITGTQWWTDYQPVSHKIQSKRGSRAQFAAMVSTCNSAGVGILVDAVLNLTAGGGNGVAGDAYSQYNYPAVPYSSDDFHSPCDIDYSNANSIYTCQLSGLADLKTETASVQALEAAYLSDLMSLGVAGFRLDAAKSMAPADIAAFLARLSSPPYIVQEVIWGPNQPVTPNMYEQNGNVHEFRAGVALKAAFQGGSLSDLLSWPGNGWVDSSNAVAFVTDHDTERDGSMLTAASSSNSYTLATIFLLAQTYGAPEILSSYEFSSFDQGAPLDSNNNALDTACFSNGWRCEQRWQAIVNMVAFHNAASGTSQTNVLASTANQISFGRGNVGHVVINSARDSWSPTLMTSVPDGSYCEIIHDTDTSFTGCSSTTITVSGGRFSVTIAPYDAVAFFVGSA